MNQKMYDSTRARVLAGLVQVHDSTTVEELRHLAHEITFGVLDEAAATIRRLDGSGYGGVTTQSALLAFGQRE